MSESDPLLGWMQDQQLHDCLTEVILTMVSIGRTMMRRQTTAKTMKRQKTTKGMAMEASNQNGTRFLEKKFTATKQWV